MTHDNVTRLPMTDAEWEGWARSMAAIGHRAPQEWRSDVRPWVASREAALAEAEADWRRRMAERPVSPIVMLPPPDTSWVTTAPVTHPRAYGGVGRHRPLTDHGLLSRLPVPGLGQVGAALAMVAFLAALCALVLS